MINFSYVDSRCQDVHQMQRREASVRILQSPPRPIRAQVNLQGVRCSQTCGVAPTKAAKVVTQTGSLYGGRDEDVYQMRRGQVPEGILAIQAGDGHPERGLPPVLQDVPIRRCTQMVLRQQGASQGYCTPVEPAKTVWHDSRGVFSNSGVSRRGVRHLRKRYRETSWANRNAISPGGRS